MKILLLGSGELGKEFTIAAQRIGQIVIAVDNYENAPAMQVANGFEIINMLDGTELDRIVHRHQPDFIVPEIEAIRTERFYNYENQGIKVVPSAKAANFTMNRKAIRDLASKEIGLKTANYRYATTSEELKKAVLEVGIPCVVKPLMSSSGKGQSTIKTESDIEGGFAGVFGRIAEAYFQRHGDQSDALAMIAAKNHKNGVDNPWAQMRKDFGFDFCRNESEKNPYVARPLKRTDCSLVSDGAAALVLADEDTARAMGKAVRFRAAVQVNEYLPIAARDIIRFDGARAAWQRAYEQAGVGVGDLSFVETHDCFTIAELIEYEAMGLAAEGKGGRAALEGWTAAGGKLPVNRSGGLKAKGHPIGATGVSMHVLAAMQLCGQAGAMQLPRADLAGVFNMGGAAVANYVSILERSN